MRIISQQPSSSRANWMCRWSCIAQARRLSSSLRLQGGELLVVGRLRLQALHTPGHTQDSMCLCVEDRVFTGDTLLIGATGRTDLPSGDAEALYESLFDGVLKLDPALKVFPAHEYKGRSHSTIGQELAENPRLQKRDRGAFIEMMQTLNLTMPTHITEALRTNMSGGKTVAQMLCRGRGDRAVHVARRIEGMPRVPEG